MHSHKNDRVTDCAEQLVMGHRLEVQICHRVRMRKTVNENSSRFVTKLTEPKELSYSSE